MDLHNQCDNVINQCYFIFTMWSIMGLDTNCCLIFYVLTLIHLTGPLSQVVQIMCVMCNIYMNLFTYIYIERERYVHLEGLSFLLLGEHALHTHTWTELLGRKGRTH